MRVNPDGTTQECSNCGWRPEKNIGLEVRVYNCGGCGMIKDRDLNAAINVINRDNGQWGLERAPVEMMKAPSEKQESHSPEGATL